MEHLEAGNVTQLLKAWVGGESTARDKLVPLVYQELRRIASRYRRQAGAGDTLQTTALVHEAYLRLVRIDEVDWKDRAHFFAVSAQLMRRILVDAARARGSVKRGGAAPAIMLDPEAMPNPESERGRELIALDDALTGLAQHDTRRAQVVELRVFGGLSVEETADALSLSPQSVMRDWKLAKAWLLREMSRRTAPGAP